ncbi:MAG: hypothetical protein AAGD35_07350 [Actinomycetota bacterium]
MALFPAQWERNNSLIDRANLLHHRLVVAVARDDAPPLVIADQIGFDPSAGRTSIQVAVLGLGAPIVIADLDGPSPNPGLEVRTSGLWADHLCEQPYRHWSYGLEAFALAVDRPDELLGRGLGDRVPLGWELEFESDEEPEWLGPPEVDADDIWPDDGAYRQLGVAHGLLLTGSGEVAVEGRALRTHRWGAHRLGPEAVLADGAIGDTPADLAGFTWPSDDDAADDADRAVPDVAEVALPGFEEVWWVAGTAGGAATRTDYGPPPVEA